jgi:hypothetical protein
MNIRVMLMEARKRNIHRTAFVLWLISVCLWLLVAFLTLSPTGDPIASASLPFASLPTLANAVLLLGITLSLLYKPIRGARTRWNLSGLAEGMSAGIVLVTFVWPILRHSNFLIFLVALCIYLLAWLAVEFALKRLLRSYREESIYPKLVDDWRPRLRQEH